MYPDNPNLLEKSVWSKVDEIQREVQNANKYAGQPSSKSNLLITTGLLIALAWIFSVIL
jgi:hypothetical protein